MYFMYNGDPKVFDPAAVDMETSAFNQKIEKEPGACYAII